MCALLPGSASGKEALCARRRSIVCKGLAQHLAEFRLRLVAEWPCVSSQSDEGGYAAYWVPPCMLMHAAWKQVHAY
jgi:hypothetical protein